jgi:hypothetical protein
MEYVIGFLIATAIGLTGVAIGTAILTHVDVKGHQAVMSLVRMLLLRMSEGRERPLLLAAAALPIGAEVGFSSAGSGSLASLALMAWTKLPPASVVGTQLVSRGFAH